MEKKIKSSLEEFETFKTEQEKGLWKLLLIGDVFFLIASFILMFLSEGILKLGIVSWSRYWILIGGNFLIFLFLFLAFVKNFKTRLLKYVLAIYCPLLTCAWIYATDLKYAKPIFIFAVFTNVFLGIMFYDFKVLLLSNLTMIIFFGLLFSYYLKIGAPITLYEIYLIYMILILVIALAFVNLQRTRFFLAELIWKRRELEEERTSLQIKVKARTKELEELTQTLDQRVKGRTQELEKSKEELQERVNELEKFHLLTIGRELKMAELKEKIKELEEKLEKDKKS